MTQRVQTTKIANVHLKHLLKLADTCQFKAENGEWKLEAGTYQSNKKAAEHVRCEMAKQHPQRRKTIRVDITEDQERIDYLRRSRMDDVIHG